MCVRVYIYIYIYIYIYVSTYVFKMHLIMHRILFEMLPIIFYLQFISPLFWFLDYCDIVITARMDFTEKSNTFSFFISFFIEKQKIK